VREGGDYFGGGGFAYFAVAVVDAALRERVLTAARAGFGVEFVKRDGFLLGGELGEIDAGKFAGAFGILQENLASVLEGFHSDVADGQAEERADFRFVEKRVAEAFVFLHDAAFTVQHERSGKSGDAAVLDANFIGGDSDGIVDAKFFRKFLDGVLIVIVNDESENLEAVFVFVLELDEVGDFRATGAAPGGPEIQEDDFAVGIGESDGLIVQAGELEVRRRIRVTNKTDGGRLVLGSKEGRNEAEK